MQSKQMEPTVVTAVSIPTIPNAKEAQVAVSAQGNIHVTFGAGDRVYSVVSTNGGTSYSPPVLAAQTGRLSLGMRRGPRIAVAGRTVVISAVYGWAGRGADGNLLAWRSALSGALLVWKTPVETGSATRAWLAWNYEADLRRLKKCKASLSQPAKAGFVDQTPNSLLPRLRGTGGEGEREIPLP